MPRRGDSIYKRKDGRWEGRYISGYDEEGKTKYSYVYARSYDDLKKKLISCRIDTGLLEDFPDNESSNFCDIMDEWMATIRLSARETTLTRYNFIIEKHLRPYFRDYDISEISVENIEEFIDIMLTQGRLDKKGGLSKKSVTDIVSIIKNVVKHAKYRGYDVTCDLRQIKVKSEKNDIRILDQREEEKLMGVLFDRMDRSKLGILLCLTTGIRVGELCSLQGKDILMTKGIIKIRKTMQRVQNSNEKDKKTKVVITELDAKSSMRNVPIPEKIMPILAKFKAKRDAYLLTGTEDSFTEPRTMQNHFYRYAQEARLENVNFQSLRHTYAVRSIEQGVDAQTLSERLGHSQVNITLNRYSRFIKEYEQKMKNS